MPASPPGKGWWWARTMANGHAPRFCGAKSTTPQAASDAHRRRRSPSDWGSLRGRPSPLETKGHAPRFCGAKSTTPPPASDAYRRRRSPSDQGIVKGSIPLTTRAKIVEYFEAFWTAFFRVKLNGPGVALADPRTEADTMFTGA